MAEEEEKPSVPQSPGEITPENAHLVDYDNLKVRLVCLVSEPKQFTSVSTFLQRRGWEVFETTELKDALTQAGTFNPDFVIISVNHPHKKIKQFPQIVAQTFNVPTIVFGEQSDARTMAALQASRAPHKIMGHLSGPTVQRNIKKILQDRHQPRESQKEPTRPYGKGQDDASVQKFSGGGSPTDKGPMIFEKDPSEVKNSGGYNPFKDGGSQSAGKKEQSGGAAYKPPDATAEELAEKPKELNAAEKIIKDKEKAELSVAEKIQKDKEEMAKALQELGSDIGKGSLDRGEDTDTDAGVSVEQSQKAKDNSIVSQGATSKEMKNTSKEVGAGDSNMNIQKGVENKSQGSASEEAYKPKQKKKAYVMESEYVPKKRKGAKMQDYENQSFIEKGTISVVNKMKAEDHDEPGGMGLVSRVALLSVGHDKHKGYFMIAGHDIGMSLDDFVGEFKTHFMAICQETAEVMEFGDYVNMGCPDYDFFDNGEEGLEFNFVSNFGAGEVGVKFIHDEEAWAHVEQPGNHEKSLIKTEQIVENKPLEIDLFVHLERNNKYYKIAGKTSELSTPRKEKLVEKKTEVFINNEDVGSYRQFQTKQKALKAIHGTVQRTTKKKAS